MTDQPPTTSASSSTTGEKSEAGSEYRIELDAYAGPLDLLLYLVKRHEIDLEEIPIARLTDQYMEHLKLIQRINVEQASEFLVMAATLLEIKSRTLMPRGKRSDDDSQSPADQDAEGEANAQANADDGSEDLSESFDPRSELVQQLLAYKRYKDAALALERRGEQWAGRFEARVEQGQAGAWAFGLSSSQADDGSAQLQANTAAEAMNADPTGQAALGFNGEPGEAGAAAGAVEAEAQADAQAQAQPVELDLEDVHVLDLCKAFNRLLESIGSVGDHEVTYDETPVSLHAQDIADRLKRDAKDRRMTLEQIFAGRRNKSEMIGLFLALLELVRERAVAVYQEQFVDELAPQIMIELRSDEARASEAQAEAQADADSAVEQWRDPDTGEMVYDWPDEHSRQRYQRRQRRRTERQQTD